MYTAQKEENNAKFCENMNRRNDTELKKNHVSTECSSQSHARASNAMGPKRSMKWKTRAHSQQTSEYFERLISLFFLQIAFTSTRKLCAPLYFSWRSFSILFWVFGRLIAFSLSLSFSRWCCRSSLLWPIYAVGALANNNNNTSTSEQIKKNGVI